MNILDKFLLMLILLPSGFYETMGVDTKQLKAILVAKLTIGNRTPSGFRGFKSAKAAKPSKFQSVGKAIAAIFMGFLFVFALFIGVDYVTKLTFYFSFYIFFLASMLVADFTTVLFDVRDNAIILPKPVNDRTFVMARLLHIILFVAKVVIPLTLISNIWIAYVTGFWGLLVFIALIVLATLFTIFLINAVYILVLKITTPQRFKNIISYFQIVFAITIYGAYQLIPRLVDTSFVTQLSLTDSYWAMLAPPYWFAGAWEYLHLLNGNIKFLFCLLLALAVPFISIYVVIKFFAPSFNQKLAMVGNTAEDVPVLKTHKSAKANKKTYSEWISRLLVKPGAERMAFLHTWKMTARSRDFKMAIYPSLGYLLVYAVLIFMRKGSSANESFFPDPNSFIYIFIVYICNFVLITVLSQLKVSDQYKAAWIYYAAPVEKPGSIILGAVKSILAKFYLPVAFVLTGSAYLFLGTSALPNFILGICNQLLIILIITYISFHSLPFSVPAAQKGKGSNFIKSLFSMLIPITIALLHYAIRTYWPIVLLLTLLSGIAIWMMLDSIKNKEWSSIK